MLTCHICSNSYENPKILSCWHSFCLKCLEEYIPENSLSLVCPLCFVSSVLPASG
uniref:RING-type domain-containing protein n=1 Tax=Helobdella robusta TaxID=6412 RepID=T1EK73_HELRO